jgi:hypothetical protein
MIEPVTYSPPALPTSRKPPTNLEWDILEQIRLLLSNKKHSMIVVRVDGLAVQVYEASPVKRIAE